MIERVPLDGYFGRNVLDVYKPLRDEGWDVEILIAPDQKTVVCLACRVEDLRTPPKSRWLPGWEKPADPQQRLF